MSCYVLSRWMNDRGIFFHSGTLRKRKFRYPKQGYPAVSSRNVAIYNSSDYIVRQTIIHLLLLLAILSMSVSLPGTRLSKHIYMEQCLPSSFHVFLESREALGAPDLGLLLLTVCCSLWFWLSGRNLKNVTTVIITREQWITVQYYPVYHSIWVQGRQSSCAKKPRHVSGTWHNLVRYRLCFLEKIST